MNLAARIAVFTLMIASSCFGRDIYVSGRSGDDRNTGYYVKDPASVDGPVRTIKRALELARSGDRIVLDPKGGPYRESIALVGNRLGGLPDWPLIIEGSGSVLEGSEPLPPEIWQHFRNDIYRFQLTMQPVDMTFFHILRQGEPLKKIEVAADARSIPALEPESWCLDRGFVYFRAAAGKTPLLPDDYELSYSHRMSGISLVQVLNVRLHDLTLQGFQLDGVSAVNGAQNIVLDNVVCRANGRSGLSIGGASSVYAGYCGFENNHSTQVLALPYSKGHLYECNVSEDGINRSSSETVIVIENEK